MLDEADARPSGYEGRSGARIWPTLQTIWAEGDHETVISALQMMIHNEVVYQKNLESLEFLCLELIRIWFMLF